VKIERQGRIALLRLEAGKANAINDAFLGDLEGLLEEVTRSGSGAVVMTGYERFFSAGLDLRSLLAMDRATLGSFVERFHGVFVRFFSHPQPVVAAINGHAIAGGCVLALQADHRLMAAGEARIGLTEVQLGVGLPSAALEAARYHLSPAAFQEVTLEGRLYDPEGARAIGLVHEVVPLDSLESRALEVADRLAKPSPEGFAQVKAGVRRPALEALAASGRADVDAWLDTWFSDGAQARLQEAVASLGDKG